MTDQLIQIARQANAKLNEGNDIVSIFVRQELAQLLNVDESEINFQTPEWQQVVELVHIM